ncbi:MAG: hypothetical protein HC831_19900 [Chloroflexia bacterium]|nr:hypothetical protein [Chloroflexia bacterium]
MGIFHRRRLVDRVYRLPRIWSNSELKKIAHLFEGDVVNVSGWQDKDKEGGFYKNYFINASSYTLTNFKEEMRGLQGYDNEIFLDLEAKLPDELETKYNVVFNHTTLEHIYNFHRAFKNICLMSKDIVIIVVPFLQEMHGSYGDYWRFSPQAIKNMFMEESFELLYLSYNDHKNASVYLFVVASKVKEKWTNIFDLSKIELSPTPFLGSNVYKKTFFYIVENTIYSCY